MTAPAPANAVVLPPSGFTSIRQFFDDFLSELMARDLSRPTTMWCLEWEKHLEAEFVIEALWEIWEEVRKDPIQGKAVFMRDFVYRLMPELFSPDGTFASCTKERHDPDGVMPLP